MCGIACLQSKWTPAIFPDYRAPKRAGWTIAELPEGIPTDLRRAWPLRKLRNNRNGHDAVEEALLFLQNNHVELSNELRHAIENRADYEWCGYEPLRCRHRAQVNKAGAPKAIQVKVSAVVAPIVVQKATVRPGHQPKCCGG